MGLFFGYVRVRGHSVEPIESGSRENILPGLAVYQVLRAEGQAQEVALAKVDELFGFVAAPFRRRLEWLGRFPLIYPFLRLYIRVAMRQYPPDGWETDWVENSPEAIRFNMRSCYYFDTLIRQIGGIRFPFHKTA